MKSIFIILFSLATYGVTRYVFSQKRIKQQITKTVKVGFFIRHLKQLNIIMMLIGLISFIFGLIAILYEYYGVLVFCIALMSGAFYYYYSILGRTIPNAEIDLCKLSEFSDEGFCTIRLSIYNTTHVRNIFWKDISKVYFNEDKTALLMDSNLNLKQPYYFSNKIENWETLLKHIPKRFGAFEAPTRQF